MNSYNHLKTQISPESKHQKNQRIPQNQFPLTPRIIKKHKMYNAAIDVKKIEKLRSITDEK